MYTHPTTQDNSKIGMPDSKDNLEVVWKVWKVSDRCQDGVLMLSGQCLDGLWNSNSTFLFTM